MRVDDEGDSAPPPAVDGPAHSKTESIKLASDHLRGGLATSASSDASHFDERDSTLLKFHGIYQQDDRDQRVKRGEPREKSWQMMIRLTIPGGVISAEQYLSLDALSDQVGNGTLRITTRQSIQFHGVAKGGLKPLVAGVNETLLTTLAACGDVSRNVMACPAPFDTPVHRDVQLLARRIAEELRPRTRAYAEIWLDGERVSDTRDAEPVYGDSYLPRKFKVGIALDTDNSVDIFSYDCGLMAITENGYVRGYNLLVGGGFGMTHNKPATFARVATPIAFVEPEHAADTVRAVCELFRDEGNRADRRNARLKYLVERWGTERFTLELAGRVPFKLRPAVDVPAPPQPDYLGVHPQGDGLWFAGVFVRNGRVADVGEERTRTAFCEIARVLAPGIRLTPMQSILFTDLSENDLAVLHHILHTHGVRKADALHSVERYSMACPALPTCGLALADSERALPGVISRLECEVLDLGVSDVPIAVRMTGCPNGCARPYNADIGFVGRRPGVYHVYVGGGLRGDRLADLFAADVALDDLVPTLRPLLERFARERGQGELLGDFYQRAIGADSPRRILTGSERPTAAALASDVVV